MAAENKNISLSERSKELLADPRHRIALDAFVNEQLRAALDALTPTHFPVSGGVPTNEDFIKRVAAYENAIGDLIEVVILLARWGDAEGRLQLEKIFSRLAETVTSSGGNTLLLHLRSYPLLLLMYAAGITALVARRFDMLAVVLATPVRGDSGSGQEPLANAALTPLTSIGDSFKVLPGRESSHSL